MYYLRENETCPHCTRNERTGKLENGVDERDQRAFCAQTSPGGYQCTKLRGHEGEHVACGIETHELEVWS